MALSEVNLDLENDMPDVHADESYHSECLYSDLDLVVFIVQILAFL